MTNCDECRHLCPGDRDTPSECTMPYDGQDVNEEECKDFEPLRII